MPKLIVLRGLPASGKTTWGDNYTKEHPKERVLIVNRDDLRLELFGRKKNASDKWDHDKEKTVIEQRDRRMLDGLKAGRTVINTDTNFNDKHINIFKAMAKVHGAEFILHDLHVPVSEAEERDARRDEGGVGPKVIRRFWRDNVCKPYAGDTTLPRIITQDIDGCLAHANHRDIYQEQLIHTDDFDEIVGAASQAIAKALGARIIITSGRHDSCQKATEDWLHDHGFEYDEIHLRKSGDNRPDYVVKREIFESLMKRYYIIAAIDDRQQVCDLLREMGVKVFQPADGRF